ncbi:MAG: SPOR domain-containing protein [Bacteroidales bacterium]|jgi:hypothetical protein
MKKISLPFILILIIVFSFSELVAQSSKTSYTAGEREIFNQINLLRKNEKKSQLVLSDKLSYVAQLHITDLKDNYKSETGCSLHSWSDKGNWSACCNAKNMEGINCMKVKPNEITGYEGLGFELIYWDNQRVNANEAVEMWTENQASKDMILCTGKWSSFDWKVMGVAMDDNYAIIWFGNRLETSPVVQQQTKPTSIESTTTKNIEDNTTNIGELSSSKYHIVVSSLKSREIAQETVDKYKKQGYKNAKVIDNKSLHRIIIDSFNNESDARKALSDYKAQFPDCWLLIL